MAAEIVTDETFTLAAVPPGTRRVLLLNPPVYDAQYWARWSQPAGLLRIATYLKSLNYHVDLIDCMETDAKGLVPKRYRVTFPLFSGPGEELGFTPSRDLPSPALLPMPV